LRVTCRDALISWLQDAKERGLTTFNNIQYSQSLSALLRDQLINLGL